jgi:hypothetical protein
MHHQYFTFFHISSSSSHFCQIVIFNRRGEERERDIERERERVRERKRERERERERERARAREREREKYRERERESERERKKERERESTVSWTRPEVPVGHGMLLPCGWQRPGQSAVHHSSACLFYFLFPFFFPLPFLVLYLPSLLFSCCSLFLSILSALSFVSSPLFISFSFLLFPFFFVSFFFLSYTHAKQKLPCLFFILQS